MYSVFSCRPLVATSNARWRAFMVLLMGIFGQWSGNGLGYYNVSPLTLTICSLLPLKAMLFYY